MSGFFSALSVGISILCLIVTVWSARRASRVVESPRAKLRSIESQLELLASSVSDWSRLTTDLAQSLKMMRVRNQTKLSSSGQQDEELPDPYKEGEAWKKAMNKRLAMARHAGGKP